MVTASILFTLLGFLSCYHSSERAKFNIRYSVQFWLKRNSKKANYIGILGLISGLSFSILSSGWITGLIYFMMILTLIASLCILIMPLNITSLKLWSALFVLSFIMEIYIL